VSQTIAGFRKKAIFGTATKLQNTIQSQLKKYVANVNRSASLTRTENTGALGHVYSKGDKPFSFIEWFPESDPQPVKIADLNPGQAGAGPATKEQPADHGPA
jgi:hypothetical protein